MATRSNIGILSEDGKIEAIYSHSDGYPSGVGKTLRDHYTDIDKIEKLINLGDVSYLEKNITKPEGHSFNNRIDGYSIFYGRDRGDENTEAQVYDSLDEVQDNDFTYIWDDEKGKWFFTDNYRDKNKKIDLATADLDKFAKGGEVSDLKMKLEKLDPNGNTSVMYDQDTKEYYWEDYKNDTYRDGYKSEKEAYKDLISHLNSFAKGGKVKQDILLEHDHGMTYTFITQKEADILKDKGLASFDPINENYEYNSSFDNSGWESFEKELGYIPMAQNYAKGGMTGPLKLAITPNEFSPKVEEILDEYGVEYRLDPDYEQLHRMGEGKMYIIDDYEEEDLEDAKKLLSMKREGMFTFYKGDDPADGDMDVSFYKKGGAIYEGHKVKIKDSGKTMKVTDISKNKKNQVEFSGDEGTYLIGDIEKMEKGGEIKTIIEYQVEEDESGSGDSYDNLDEAEMHWESLSDKQRKEGTLMKHTWECEDGVCDIVDTEIIYAKGGVVSDNKELITGGILGILLGIFLNK